MSLTVAVFVSSINKIPYSKVQICASNGNFDGPPKVTWEVTEPQAKSIYIGQRYKVTIEEEPWRDPRNAQEKQTSTIQ